MPTKPTNEQIDRVVDEWYGKDVSRPATLNHLPRWLIEDLKSKLHELCKDKWHDPDESIPEENWYWLEGNKNPFWLWGGVNTTGRRWSGPLEPPNEEA